MKKCGHCKTNKEGTDFSKSQFAKSGGACKECLPRMVKERDEKRMADKPSKMCHGCNSEKMKNAFSDSAFKKSGGKCRDCNSKEYRERQSRPSNDDRGKFCRGCHIEKSREEFSKSEFQNGESQCKMCISKYYYDRQKKELSIEKTSNICSHCSIEKNKLEFSSSQFKTGGWCKECKKNYNVEQQSQTLNDVINKNCNQCHLEKCRDDFSNSQFKCNSSKCRACVKKNNAEYVLMHKDERQIAKNKWEKKRTERDPLFKLRKRVSNMIHRALSDSNETDSISDYLPYTIQQLHNHLESLFEPWMTWENWSIYDPKTYDEKPTWNIDHIIPQSMFKFATMRDEAFRNCWALSNLRPLSSKQNVMDGFTRVRHESDK